MRDALILLMLLILLTLTATVGTTQAQEAEMARLVIAPEDFGLIEGGRLVDIEGTPTGKAVLIEEDSGFARVILKLGEGGDLRKVGDTKHLSPRRQGGKLPSHRQRGLSPGSGVDLVKGDHRCVFDPSGQP